MNIPLKQRYLDWIAEQVSAGRYASEIEAVEDALALKIERDESERLETRMRQSEREHSDGRYVVADEAFFERKKQMILDRVSADRR